MGRYTGDYNEKNIEKKGSKKLYTRLIRSYKNKKRQTDREKKKKKKEKKKRDPHSALSLPRPGGSEGKRHPCSLKWGRPCHGFEATWDTGLSGLRGVHRGVILLSFQMSPRVAPRG